MPGQIGCKSIEIDTGRMPLTGNVISMDLHPIQPVEFDVCKADNWSCASDDKSGKVLHFNGLKGCKSNFGHFGSKYAGILLFQFNITELFNIELMEWFLVQKVAFEISNNLI